MNTMAAAKTEDWTHLLGDDITDWAIARTGAEGRVRTSLYLEIDPDNEVSLVFEDYIDGDTGCAEDVYFGRRLQFTVSPTASVGELRALLAEGGRAAEYIDRILCGSECEFFGGDPPERHTDQDAQDAKDSLRDLLLRDLDGNAYRVWTAGDWIGGVYGRDYARLLEDHDLAIESTPDQIADAADDIIQNAFFDCVVFTSRESVVGFLEYAQEQAAEAAEEEAMAD